MRLLPLEAPERTEMDAFPEGILWKILLNVNHRYSYHNDGGLQFEASGDQLWGMA